MRWGSRKLWCSLFSGLVGTAMVSGSFGGVDGVSAAREAKEPDEESGDEVKQAQDVRIIRPDAPVAGAAPVPESTEIVATSFVGPGGIPRSQLSAVRRERASRTGADVVLGSESTRRPSSDIGSLLGRSQSASGVTTQRRTPIITDPRARGTHLGQLLARGSYWVPARQDLDTMVSKLDSSIINDVIVIKGPYSSIYGPGLSFLDIHLLQAPRYDGGPELHGRSSLNYQTNGEQWYGRETLWGGSQDWGFRAGYGHRTGSDYETGSGDGMPSSYKSRDVDVTFGFDLSEDRHLDITYLRLDQTDVEFPGQIFDIDFLVTDAFEAKYRIEDQARFDELRFDTWYNRTRFEGNAQRSGKRRQIPELNCDAFAPVCFNARPDPNGILDFFGLTDVDAMTTGFRLGATWGDDESPRLTAGADLRYVKQRLNEVDLSPELFTSIAARNFNFPIPDSHSSNPGLFIEHAMPVAEPLVVRSGARVDWVSTNAERRVANTDIDLDGVQDDLEDILGGSFDQHFVLWSAYVAAECELDPHWTATAAAGYAMRPPTLTELYSAQSFLAILQQGFTFVTGDPNLDPERLYQVDVGLRAEYERCRGGVSGFYAWIPDYITYEANFRIAAGIVPRGLGVTFTNTDLATLAGGEAYAEYDWNEWLTPFARFSYVEGRDHARDNRGFIPGSDKEPLPGISPLESRLGIRLHEPTAPGGPGPRWGVELTARAVDNQDRVATSLEEQSTPGFTTWDLRSYYQATQSLLLVAGIENFTDKQYREHLDLRTGRGVFQPGINFYFGCELKY